MCSAVYKVGNQEFLRQRFNVIGSKSRSATIQQELFRPVCTVAFTKARNRTNSASFKVTVGNGVPCMHVDLCVRVHVHVHVHVPLPVCGD